jgi:hypothetical protein
MILSVRIGFMNINLAFQNNPQIVGLSPLIKHHHSRIENPDFHAIYQDFKLFP